MEGIIGLAIGFGICVVIPLVAILVSHQQKMTKMLSGDPTQNQALAQRLRQMEAEITELRALVNDQVLRVDDRRRIAGISQGEENRLG
jgi:alkylation response protein AidB-like acyl-CoA dehydrogenase